VHRVQGRFSDAETILEAGMRRLPRDPEIMREYARLPLAPGRGDQKDWPTAFGRLERLRNSFPSYEPGWLESIRCARDAERFDMAEELAAAAVEDFPQNAELAVQWATAALDRSDYAEAITRFAAVIERFEHHRAGHIGLANALARPGRHDD